MFDLIYREETLFNVIKSVTRNGRSILLTALLALILVYLFSIVGFLCLKNDFIMEVDPLLQLAAGSHPTEKKLHRAFYQSEPDGLQMNDVWGKRECDVCCLTASRVQILANQRRPRTSCRRARQTESVAPRRMELKVRGRDWRAGSEPQPGWFLLVI